MKITQQHKYSEREHGAGRGKHEGQVSSSERSGMASVCDEKDGTGPVSGTCEVSSGKDLVNL